MRDELAATHEKTRWMNELSGPLDIPEVRKVDEVCSVLWGRKGKRLRAQWVLWFGEAFGCSPEQLKLYVWAVEAIHTATLLHDDVIDRASLRRGGASANAIYDNTLPVLSGDFLLSDAIFQLAENGNSFLTKLMCRAVKEVTQGEVLQYEHRFKIPESGEYFEKLNRLKTSALLKWASQVGPILATSRELPECTAFANIYGSLYQFTDDILDLRGSPTKESGQDIREGKVNEVTFLLLDTFPSLKSELLKVFSEKTIGLSLLKKLEYYSKEKAFQKKLEDALERKQKKCQESLEVLLDKNLRATLDKLVCFTVQRLY